MNYTDLIDKPLKCDFLNDLFETYDVEVAYEYDRTSENIEDEYRAAIPEMGLEFLFDVTQTLVALFMNQVEHTGYNPFEGEDPRSTPPNSATEAIEYAKANSINFEHREAKEDTILGSIPEWVKLFFENHSIHYSFKEDGTKTVTLQSLKA